MSAVNISVVREYFELLGYLVCQPRKYAVPGRQKKPEEEIDLVVHNPSIPELDMPDHIVWSTQDLRKVSRAIVGVRGWHTERFYVKTFEQTPEILRFAEPPSVQFASKVLNTHAMAKILCLPKLPASGDLKGKSIAALKAHGVDGVISFRTMLIELIANVEINRNYEQSDLLQVIRLLKNYELLNESQLELFASRKRRGVRRRKIAPRKSVAAEPKAG